MQIKAIFKCISDDDSFLNDEIKAVIEDETNCECVDTRIIDESYGKNDYEGNTYVIRATIETQDIAALKTALNNIPEFDRFEEED